MIRFAWQPLPGPQAALLTCPVDEIFFGGARGGGKTDGMLGKFGKKAGRYGADAVGVFFRKTREDLREAIARSQQIYGPIGAKYADQKKEWTFPNGARLKFQYLENDRDADNYQGHNYTDLFFEELQHWADPAPVNKLRATLRSAAGIPCQFHATGNPGGVGHQWVKKRYINPCPVGWKILKETFANPFTGEKIDTSRIFIPSRLTENRYTNTPEYIARLHQVGSEKLVRSWVLGDWSVVEGAFFDKWSRQMILRPFTPPPEWSRFLSGDWGYAKPFSFGWWCVAGEDTRLETVDGAFAKIKRGALIRYREWYGAEEDAQGETIPNKGLRLEAEAVAEGVLKRMGDDTAEAFRGSVLDPSAFARDGGPSIAERMFGEGVRFRRADNKRVGVRGAMGGWDHMRSMMRSETLFCTADCVDSIRTIPALQHDANRAEDLDTDAEDHAADDWRYAVMSRAKAAKVPETEEGRTKAGLQELSQGREITFNDLRDRISRRREENVGLY